MDKKIDIWNVLHDGEITVYEREGDQLTIFISIPYLRRRVKPLGDSFVLKMTGLKQFDFYNEDNVKMRLAEGLLSCSHEIVSVETERMPIEVKLDWGRMILDYDDIQCSYENGDPVTFEKIRHISDEYWTEWNDGKSRAFPEEG